MEERVHVIREYGFADLGKVLLAGLKRAIICAVIVTVLLGGTLSCFTLFVAHDEYAASVVKIDDAYDVPIIRVTFRKEIQTVLPEIFEDEALNEDQLDVLSREFDDHITIDEQTGANSVYTFTLTSFSSSVLTLEKDDFSAVLNAVTSHYHKKYAEKIVSSYTVETDSQLGVDFSTANSNNYYLQTEILSSYLDSVINEIQTIANINTGSVTQPTDNSTFPPSRSDFSAYCCPENNRRVSDSLLALNAVRYEISYAQSYISRNGIEKAGAKPMSEYIQGQLLNSPDSYPWSVLADKFGENSPYGQANETERQALAQEAERLIADVVLQLQTVVNDYNLIARGFANSIVDEYVVFSSLAEDDAVDTFTVVVITVAGAVISVLLCYVLQFYKMQKEGSIGVEVSEEADEA